MKTDLRTNTVCEICEGLVCSEPSPLTHVVICLVTDVYGSELVCGWCHE